MIRMLSHNEMAHILHTRYISLNLGIRKVWQKLSLAHLLHLITVRRFVLTVSYWYMARILLYAISVPVSFWYTVSFWDISQFDTFHYETYYFEAYYNEKRSLKRDLKMPFASFYMMLFRFLLIIIIVIVTIMYHNM